jgi:hypothetical protein
VTRESYCGVRRSSAYLECVVAPGSSGAPVVDDLMAVCGFIVAGSVDPEQPRSFAYTARFWMNLLTKKRPAKPARKAKPKPIE